MSDTWILIVLLGLALVIALYPFGHALKTNLLWGPLLIVLVMLGYWHWGAYPAWNAHLQQQTRLKQLQSIMQSMQTPEALIAKLKTRVLQKPSARGWYLLGRLYASQGDWQLAHDAFFRAHRLKPNDEKITINYAQGLWQLNQQSLNNEVRTLLESVLKQNKNQPDALAMIAMDAFQHQAYQQAIDYWQRILSVLPPQSADANAIRKAIAKAQQRLITH